MKKYNVLGIGNAVVDVISQSSDMFLEKMNIDSNIDIKLFYSELTYALRSFFEKEDKEAKSSKSSLNGIFFKRPAYPFT
mgnify:CR=1 FL=1